MLPRTVQQSIAELKCWWTWGRVCTQWGNSVPWCYDRSPAQAWYIMLIEKFTLMQSPSSQRRQVSASSGYQSLLLHTVSDLSAHNWPFQSCQGSAWWKHPSVTCPRHLKWKDFEGERSSVLYSLTYHSFKSSITRCPHVEQVMTWKQHDLQDDMLAESFLTPPRSALSRNPLHINIKVCNLSVNINVVIYW